MAVIRLPAGRTATTAYPGRVHTCPSPRDRSNAAPAIGQDVAATGPCPEIVALHTDATRSTRLRFLCGAPLLALLLATPACAGSAMPEPKRNAHPRETYEIRVRVENAPMPLPMEHGYADYRVLDESCLPVSNPIAGVKQHPMHREPLVYSRTQDGSFQARVSRDLLVDEDYFGLGQCRWTLVSVAAQAKLGDRTIHASIDGRSLPGRSATFYPKADAGPTVDEFLDIGQPTPAAGTTSDAYFVVHVEGRRIGR